MLASEPKDFLVGTDGATLRIQKGVVHVLDTPRGRFISSRQDVVASFISIGGHNVLAVSRFCCPRFMNAIQSGLEQMSLT